MSDWLKIILIIGFVLVILPLSAIGFFIFLGMARDKTRSIIYRVLSWIGLIVCSIIWLVPTLGFSLIKIFEKLIQLFSVLFVGGSHV